MPSATPAAPTPYDRAARDAIAAWKRPSRLSPFNLLDRFTRPLDLATGWVAKSPLGASASQLLTGVLGVIGDGASWSINREAIYAKFAANGHPGITHGTEVQALELAQVDAVVGALATPYVLAGMVEGTATGIGGGLGLVADIPLILALNLRAISDFATHYGFDTQAEAERAYGLGMLNYALAPTADARHLALERLDQLDRAIALGQSSADLWDMGGPQGLHTLSNSIGQRMAKAKAGQMVPFAGAVVGGGFNAWLTRKNCDAAYHLYRERFLNQKFGRA